MKNYKAPEMEIVRFTCEDIMDVSVADTPVLNNNGEYVYQSTGTTTYGTFWK